MLVGGGSSGNSHCVGAARRPVHTRFQVLHSGFQVDQLTWWSADFLKEGAIARWSYEKLSKVPKFSARVGSRQGWI